VAKERLAEEEQKRLEATAALTQKYFCRKIAVKKLKRLNSFHVISDLARIFY
jgi:hypothetical protein